MKAIALTFSVLMLIAFTYLAVSAYVLRYMIDAEKVKDHGPKLFRNITPPRSVLTPLGVKVWWSRWIALGVTIICLIASFHFQELAK